MDFSVVGAFRLASVFEQSLYRRTEVFQTDKGLMFQIEEKEYAKLWNCEQIWWVWGNPKYIGDLQVR